MLLLHRAGGPSLLDGWQIALALAAVISTRKDVVVLRDVHEGVPYWPQSAES